MRYFIIEERRNEIFDTEFETVEEALKMADLDWNKFMTPWEKNQIIEYYVGAFPDYVDRENLFDYDFDIVKRYK